MRYTGFPEKVDECLQFKCGTNTAEFYSLKCKKVGRSIAIYQAQRTVVGPTKFENLAETQEKDIVEKEY